MVIFLAVEEGIALLPDAPELIWGLVAFLMLMIVMFRFVFPRANEALDERRAAIQGKLEEADAKLAEAEASKRAFDASIADAQGEANRIIEDARATAESLRRDIVAKAEDEAASLLEKARADVRAERERLLQELRTQIGTLSVDLAGKIVERELDAATHGNLVDEYIQNLARTN